MPPRRSRGARHPIVIVGNAIFTIILLLAVVLGVGVYWGKQKFEEPGPLTEDKVVNIPRGLGIRDIAELLAREGVIRDPWIFIGGALALKARGDDTEIRRISVREGREPARRRADHDRRQGGAASGHGRRRADLRTDRRAAAGERAADRRVKEMPREGTLLPESYRFTRGTTREDIVKRMQAAQRNACCRRRGIGACRICR